MRDGLNQRYLIQWSMILNLPPGCCSNSHRLADVFTRDVLSPSTQGFNIASVYPSMGYVYAIVIVGHIDTAALSGERCDGYSRAP